MSFIRELFDFLGTRRKFWLWPVLVLMFLLGALLVLGQSSAVAPFIYTLF